ncbi:MAG TPA: DUF4347 domain-containing protein, partial [Aquabacterium sp.]|uniref:DUF4347 domain-containing protein n=1 Tax=Aquabacterium sp. TaxID=1872578 RepID=UPI002E363884
MRGPPRSKPPHRRPRYELEELEPRRLFSADPLVGALLGTGFALDTGGTAASIDVVAESLRVVQAVAPQSAQSNATAPAREVVFVDMGIDDASVILSDLHKQQEQGRPIDVVALSSQDDGISIITSYLNQQTDKIGAIHILSHGDANGLQLGSTWLDESTLSARLGAISSWGASLTSEADLLLYGCQLASAPGGMALIDQLALLTGADVAASDDYTGSALLGGDWILEYTTGEVNHTDILTFQAQGQWQHVLATVTFQEGVSSYTGTQDTYIDKAAPTTSHATSTGLQVDDGTPNDMQSLVRFDNIIGSAQIPLGSTITSATLTVYVTNNDTADDVTIHKMLVTWDESSTYNSLSSGVATNGVEADSSGLFTLDAGISGAANFTGLASSVQAWANGGTNYGWVIVTGDANADNWTFASSE